MPRRSHTSLIARAGWFSPPCVSLPRARSAAIPISTCPSMLISRPGVQRQSETIAFLVPASDVFWKGLGDFRTTSIDHSVSQPARV